MRHVTGILLRSVRQALKLPEVRHFFKGFRREVSRTGRAGNSWVESCDERAELRQNKVARALDRRRSCGYNQELQSLHLQKKKGNMPFFILFLPVKILIIWMFLQHLLGG